MDRRVDIAFAAAFVILGIFVIFEASTIELGLHKDPIGPRKFFYGCAVVMILGGLAVIARRLMNWRDAAGNEILSEGMADEEGHDGSALRAGSVFLACMVYTLLLQPLGYLLATPPFVFASLAILKQRQWIAMAIVSLVFTAVFYLTFAQLLSVRLPVGPFTDLFRELGWIIL